MYYVPKTKGRIYAVEENKHKRILLECSSKSYRYRITQAIVQHVPEKHVYSERTPWLPKQEHTPLRNGKKGKQVVTWRVYFTYKY
jgi:hypothetical protein